MNDTGNSIRKFELVLEHDVDAADYQYEPGELLRGAVVLVVDGAAPSLSADSICVELRGEAQVCWQQQDRVVDSSRHDDQHRRRHRQRRQQQQHVSDDGSDVIASSSRTQRPVRSRTTTSRSPVLGQNNDERQRQQLHSAVETYVDERRTVWTSTDVDREPHVDDVVDGGAASTARTISPGEHRYPFEFRLPVDLPTSFRGQYGSVGYAVRAFVVGRHRLMLGGRTAVVKEPFFVKRRHQPLTTTNTSTTHGVTLYRKSDVDGNRKLQQHRRSTTVDRAESADDAGDDDLMVTSSADAAVVLVVVSKRPSRSLLCCVGAAAASRVRAEFIVADGIECRLGGYFRVDIVLTEGGSRRRLSAVDDVVFVEASLVQVCTFTASTGRRRRTVALVSRRSNDGKPSAITGDRTNRRRWTDFRLSVPTNLPESGLVGCSIIDVGYELRFAVEISGRNKLKARLPVSVYSALVGDVTTGKDAVTRDVIGAELANVAAAGQTAVKQHDVIITISDTSDDDITKFRRPMLPGETRQNLIYDPDLSS